MFKLLRAATSLPLLALLGAGCGEDPSAPPGGGVLPAAPEVTSLAMARVDADLSKLDPGAAFWSSVAAGSVSLMAQPVIAPRPETVTTDRILVQAVHDGVTAAFRLSWTDTELSEAGLLGEYSDAVALQFPIAPGDPPPVFMGGLGSPVHIFHWRAQYQRDAEKGKPEMHDLYPNASVDMYAMDFHDAPSGSRDEREMFNPAIALGNPQSSPKSGVDEIIAEGFATSAVQANHQSRGRGVWNDGLWSVVLTRPLGIEGGSTLRPGTSSFLTFAVWQGGKGEVGSRKSVHLTWVPLEVAT